MSTRFSFLPADLSRWDAGPGGDVIVVPIWTNVRPLRGTAGLVDWRLCGKVSQVIREGRLSGALGEKLLLVTNRLRWRRVLIVGLGETDAFTSDTSRAAIDFSLQALHGIGSSNIAIALPGRDMDLVATDEAFRQLRDAIAASERSGGAWLDGVVVIDTPAASKVIGSALAASAPAAPA